jgi:DNA-binding beta-propeller fold protein YncE
MYPACASVVLVLTLGCGPAAREPKGEPSPLREVQRIPLDGVEGRIDHLAFDAKNDRLYVAALGNNTVEIIDLKSGKRAGQIRGVQEPQGVWVLPESATLVVASGEDGKCRFYDADRKLLGAVDGLDDADNVRYDPAARLVYVGYGQGASGALAVINAETMRKVADVRLDGHPESFRLEEKGNRVFVNVPAREEVVVIDRDRRAVSAKWRLREARQNFPMFLDEEHRRLFVGCRTPAKLLVLDTEAGTVVQALDCTRDTDDVFYDAPKRLAYVSGGGGSVSVFRQQDADHYVPAGAAATADGARTSLFVPDTGRLYVAVPRRGTQPAEIRVMEAAP